MHKQYKTIRIARETKYWLNELINYKENQLNEVKNDLIEKYETKLKNYPDFSDGFSPTISISATSGSILEAAYNYTKKNDINWDEIFLKVEKEKNKVDTSIDIGTVTPRFYLSSDVLNGLENYRSELKLQDMQRNLMLNYVVKIVIFAYYENIFNYSD